jgi:MSHA biogenesis protein MshJ
MKVFWLRLAGRFDALQRRERMAVFAGALLALALLGNHFMIEPHLLRHAAMGKQIEAQRQAEMLLKARLAGAEARARDPDAESRKELEELRQRMARLDKEHQAMQSRLVPPDAMAALLEGMLRKSRGLSLVALTTLPASSVVEQPAAQDRKAVAGEAEAAQTAGLYKHGVRITVRGSYADLLEFLAQMEELPQKMYWGRLALATEAYPVSVMQLTVYTISRDKSWLVI